MFRIVFGLTTALLAGSLIVPSASAGDAKTIRIEPRGFYGATISLEAGVRVFRPLPPTTHMIINPNNAPVHLSITEETRTINKTVNHHGGYASAGGGYGGAGYIPFGPDAGNRKSGRRGQGHIRRPAKRAGGGL